MSCEDNALPTSEDDVSHESSGEEVLLEPRFKYDRINGDDVKKLLSSQLISCMAAHDKLIAIATQTGFVWIMDHLGFGDHTHMPVFRPHRCSITRIAIDESGNYVITCANDGRVAISGLGTNTLNYVLVMSTIPRSVAISPDFSKAKAIPQFVVGERNLSLYEKSFFNYKEQVIYRGGEKDNFITRISWRGQFIAFTNDGGTRIYDKQLNKMITLIRPTHDVDRIRSLFSPTCHFWIDDNTLAIGWADTVTVVAIVIPEGGLLADKRGEIHFTSRLDGFYCCGISSSLDFHGQWNSQLVFFGMKPDASVDADSFCDTASLISMDSSALANGVNPVIEVCVLESLSLYEYRLLAEDSLSLNMKPNSVPNQFYMAGMPSCDSFFFCGPTDLIVASPYSVLDTVKWRIDNRLWEDAWHLAQEKANDLEGTNYEAAQVGRGMIEYFIDENPMMALDKLKDVCADSKSEWEWAVELFEQHRLATLLAEVLPVSRPQLEPECYQSVIQAALYNDVKLFKRLVQQWSPDLYRTGSIIGMTLRRIQEAVAPGAEGGPIEMEEEISLYHALAHLYVYERKYDSAIKLYMSLKDQQIFRIIEKYNLFDMVKDQINELMAINSDLAVRLLLQNEDSVPASFVMAKIGRNPQLQMKYLSRLMKKNEGAEFADQAVKLYADHDRSKLLPFLKDNVNYNLLKALEICKYKNFTDEVILLLGKSGKHMDALNEMINIAMPEQKHDEHPTKEERKRRDKMFNDAINFCKEQEDDDLWRYLIDKVVESPFYITKLLHQAGSSIDPLLIIEKIPLSMDIEDLRDALAQVLKDCADRIDLLIGCRMATYSDSQALMSKYLFTHSKTASINTISMCSVCHSILNSAITDDAMRLFGCGHSAHLSCCLELEKKSIIEKESCAACSENTRDEIIA